MHSLDDCHKNTLIYHAASNFYPWRLAVLDKYLSNERMNEGISEELSESELRPLEGKTLPIDSGAKDWSEAPSLIGCVIWS